jgi:predicted TPR repeat methyltransferase
MAYSDKRGKTTIKEWVSKISNVNKILDIGVGAGTYRELFQDTSLNNSHWTGIEVWKPFIEKFDLEKKYNRIVCEDARTINYKDLDQFDICFAGDVLEHMTKEEAQHLINKLLESCRHIIISIPIIHYPQGAKFKNPYERHVKDDWSHEEVLDSFPFIQDSYVDEIIGVYLLNRV